MSRGELQATAQGGRPYALLVLGIEPRVERIRLMCRLELNQQVLDQENEYELRWMVMVASLQAQNSSTYSDLRAERWVQEADHPDTIQVEGRNQWFLGQQTSKRASERLECRTHAQALKRQMAYNVLERYTGIVRQAQEPIVRELGSQQWRRVADAHLARERVGRLAQLLVLEYAADGSLVAWSILFVAALHCENAEWYQRPAREKRRARARARASGGGRTVARDRRELANDVNVSPRDS